MGEWRTVALGDIAEKKGLVGGPFGSSLVSADYFPAGIPVIRGTNLNEGKYVRGDFVYVTKEKFTRDLARNYAAPGDIVFTQRGTLGQVALVPEGKCKTYVISQSQMRMRVDKKKADPEFVFYYALGPDFQSQLHARTISTGVPHINLGILSSMTISLPSLAEQKNIVQVLRALDAKIEANQQSVRVALELALTQVKILSGSAKTQLENLVEHRRRQIKPWERGVATVRHFSLPAFDQGQQPAVEDPSSIKSAKFQIIEPSVLFSKLNPQTPRIWLARPGASIESYASTEFVVLEPRNISPEILWLICAQPDVCGELVGLARGTSNSHQRVSPSDIMERRVIDPSGLPENIVNECETLVNMSESFHEEILRLKALRESIIPGLMDGNLAVRAVKDLVGQPI